MKRRHLIALSAGLSLGAVGCAAAPGRPAADTPAGTPRYKVSGAQLQQAVATRFPLRYGLPGWMNFTVKTPELRMLPEKNRLATELLVDVAGPALPRPFAGGAEAEFALRYEPSDQSIRAHDVQLGEVYLPGLPPQARQALGAYLPELAREALNDLVLHTLRPQDLALSDAMGLQPDRITVVKDGLEIGFRPRSTSTRMPSGD